MLLNERQTHLFRGSAFATVARALADSRTVDDIVATASSPLQAAEIYYALDRLEARGLIREIDDSEPTASTPFWDALGIEPARASSALTRANVTLTAIGDVSTEALASSLRSLGINGTGEGSISVVLADDYVHPALEAFNEARLRDEKPWLLARPVGSILWIGPLFRPGLTACWTCMAHRVRLQRAIESFVQTRTNDSHPRMFASYSLPSTELAAAALIATEVAKWLAGAATPELESSLLTFDLMTMKTERHAVVRRPQCVACGDGKTAASRMPPPIVLQPRTKGFTADGGFRSEPPETTITRYSRHVSPLTGVVTQLEADPSAGSPITPLYNAGLNAARQDDSIDSLRGQFRSGSGGKGKTEQQAKAGALAEAIERHSGVFDGTEPRIRASLETLGDAAIHPNACMLYSDAQYGTGPSAPLVRSSRVPVRFDERMQADWSPFWSLTHGRTRYLPAAYCYYNYPLPAGEQFCWADSNGCAAGNSLEEAILQGFLELVERDCVAIWWYNRLSRPAVDLSSFDEPYIARLQRYYRSIGREIWVLDLTGDFEIPAFAAISSRTDSAAEEIIIGFGCHLDPKIGILRAMTETNQFLPAVIDRAADAEFRTSDEEVLAWLSTATLANQPYLIPAGEPVRAQHYRRFEHDDLKDDVEACVSIAAARGMETLVLDQTRPDIGLAVVRVVVPGLRHFWQRLAPGRLYDVPVSLGWLRAPLAEDDLNPIAVFF